MHRMKKNAMSLTIIAVISAVTVSVLCFATITQENSNNTFKSIAPQDFNLTTEKQAQLFKTIGEKSYRLSHQNV